MKKQQQLGMNPSTASHRLVKDILFNMVERCNENSCYHCKQPMSRDNFSIEHKTPWLDSEDPIAFFFDLGNVGFSHLRCNFSAARRTRQIYATREDARQEELKRNSATRREKYSPQDRAKRYKETGH